MKNPKVKIPKKLQPKEIPNPKPVKYGGTKKGTC